MRTIGLGKVRILGELGERKSCHNEASASSLVKDPLLTPEQSSGVRITKGYKALGVAGAKLVFWNPRKSFFDVLPTTGPGYFSAG
jgi:hypothetical protein